MQIDGFRSNAQNGLDLPVVPERLRPQKQTVGLATLGQKLLRQRRALIRRKWLVSDHDNGFGEATLAQADRTLRRRLAGADDDHAAHAVTSPGGLALSYWPKRLCPNSLIVSLDPLRPRRGGPWVCFDRAKPSRQPPAKEFEAGAGRDLVSPQRRRYGHTTASKPVVMPLK
jgi:hypothetical protein